MREKIKTPRLRKLVVKPFLKPVAVFTPKTELAKRLWEIRMRSIASGENEPLLDWEGVQKEVADRRGELG